MAALKVTSAFAAFFGNQDVKIGCISAHTVKSVLQNCNLRVIRGLTRVLNLYCL